MGLSTGLLLASHLIKVMGDKLSLIHYVGLLELLDLQLTTEWICVGLSDTLGIRKHGR